MHLAVSSLHPFHLSVSNNWNLLLLLIYLNVLIVYLHDMVCPDIAFTFVQLTEGRSARDLTQGSNEQKKHGSTRFASALGSACLALPEDETFLFGGGLCFCLCCGFGSSFVCLQLSHSHLFTQKLWRFSDLSERALDLLLGLCLGVPSISRLFNLDCRYPRDLLQPVRKKNDLSRD